MKARSTRLGVNRSAGFTLAEVTFAVLVMGLVIATSVTTLQVGFRQMDTARNTTLAGQVLQSLIEDLRMMPYSTTGGVTGVSNLPATTSGPVSTFDSTNSFSSFDSQASTMLTRFTITRTVSAVTGQSGMYKIIFAASWKASVSGTRSEATLQHSAKR